MTRAGCGGDGRWPRAVLALVVAGWAAPGAAQELGLDLTDASAIPAELRPSLAVVEVGGRGTDAALQARVRQLEQELPRWLAEVGRFGEVLSPAQSASRLGSQLERARTCAAYACFEDAARALKVDRLLSVTVSRSGAGYEVVARGFDPALTKVVEQQVSVEERDRQQFSGLSTGKSKAQRAAEFLRKAKALVTRLGERLATANAALTVETNDSEVAVLVDGVEVGKGNVTRILPRGTHRLRTLSSTFLPTDQEVELMPAQRLTVRPRLVARPASPQEGPRRQVLKAAEARPVPLLARPGFYLALLGAGAVGTGVVLGQLAQDVQRRAVDLDGDGVVGVTRAQAQQARTHALLANILVGSGAALLTGGVAWVLLTPVPAPAPVEPGEPGEVAGLVLSLGGTF